MKLDLENWRQHMEDGLNADSLWLIDKNETDGLHQNDYWGQFVAQIPRQMILRYSQPGDTVLDPMMGRGTTGIEARRMGRKFIGCELQTEVFNAAAERIHKAGKKPKEPVWLVNGDFYNDEAFMALEAPQPSLAIWHPPYHNIIRFSEQNEDISTCETVTEFIDLIGQGFEIIHEMLAPKGYMVFVMGDIWHGGEYFPLAHMCLPARDGTWGGWKQKATIVKNMSASTKGKNGGKDANLMYYRALKGGTVRFCHEYIFVLQKGGR